MERESQPDDDLSGEASERPADFGDRGDWGRQGSWGTFGNRPDFNRDSAWLGRKKPGDRRNAPSVSPSERAA